MAGGVGVMTVGADALAALAGLATGATTGDSAGAAAAIGAATGLRYQPSAATRAAVITNASAMLVSASCQRCRWLAGCCTA